MYFIAETHIRNNIINHIYQVHKIHEGLGHTSKVDIEVHHIIWVHIEYPKSLLPAGNILGVSTQKIRYEVLSFIHRILFKFLNKGF